MANVTVLANGIINKGDRCNVRDSNDFVYVLVNDAGSLKMMKGNVSGEPASFAEQDSGNTPSATAGSYVNSAIDIDSLGIISVCCYFDDGAAMAASDDIRYFTFHTSAASSNQDTWQIDFEEAIDLGEPFGGLINGYLSLCVDGSDIPHIWCIDGRKDMGSTFAIVEHSRRTGGTWDAETIVTPLSLNEDYFNFSCIIGDPNSSVNADRPICMVAQSVATNHLDAYFGNALAATSWTREADVTGAINVNGSGGGRLSVIIDSAERIVCSFEEVGSSDLMIVEHLNANAWTNWETPLDVDTTASYRNPSMASDGEFLYIYSNVPSGGGEIDLFKDVGAGFVEETGDTDLPNIGAFTFVHTKYSSKNNNSPRELDYVFNSSVIIVLYNTFQGEAPPVAEEANAESGTIGNMIF